jgi:hypothetical protein
MTTEREPLLKPVAVDELRPTQITLGMREVGAEAPDDPGTKP